MHKEAPEGVASSFQREEKAGLSIVSSSVSAIVAIVLGAAASWYGSMEFWEGFIVTFVLAFVTFLVVFTLGSLPNLDEDMTS